MSYSIKSVFFTQLEAAEELNVDRHTVASWLRAGKLKGQKVAATWFIEKEEVRRMKEEREISLNVQDSD